MWHPPSPCSHMFAFWWTPPPPPPLSANVIIQCPPIKVQIWWNFMWTVEILKFCTLTGSFCPNHIKFQLKKVQKSYLSWHWRVMQSSKKNWLVVSNMTGGIWWIFTQPLKSLKTSFRWTLFVQSVQGLSYKYTEELSFMTLNSETKFE